jgi:hypothetical protein
MIRDNARRIRLAAALLAGTAVAGCSTTTTQSFNVVKDSQVESSYIAVDANFSRYDRLSAEDMGIFFPTDAAPPVEDQQRIRDIFRKAFLAQLGDYQVVRDGKGPTTLAVQASLIDFRNASTTNMPPVRREVRDIAQPGKLIFLMELKDSRSGQVLGRAADSASAPAFAATAGATTDWTAVEAAAARWAELFRQFLDRNLNK